MLISELVHQFQNCSVLVTGDAYMDRETYGQVDRLAPEAPVPVLKTLSNRSLPGGAANVARNIARLGGQALLFGHFGAEPISRELLEQLGPDGVVCSPPSLTGSSNLAERYRFFAANQQLIQLLRKSSTEEAGGAAAKLGEFARQFKPVQTIVVYDQGYGAVTPSLLQSVRETAARTRAKLLIDARPAHIHWYGPADLFTFNAAESLDACRRFGAPCISIEEAGILLSQRLASDILITRGGEGISLFQAGIPSGQIPAVQVPLADRAGAGDSVTAVLALCLAAGAPLKDAAGLANKAAGIVVGKPGIAYVEPKELVNLFQHEISGILLESAGVKQRLIEEQLPVIEDLVRAIIRTYRQDKKVCAFGNGGSAADANHLITELVGRFLLERKGLPALSFSANEILMTSIANDYGYENTFARQVEAFVREGDLVVAFSTSGKSPNVVKALELGRQRGATTVGFTGRAAGRFPELCDICIRVPSDSAPRIQESHLAVVHIICELLEKELAGVS